MPRYVAFLRAINLGGARMVKMDFLRQLFESLGFDEVETFIASGNVVFSTKRQSSSQTLERKIEGKLLEALGYDVTVFVRTGAEVVEVANKKPFPKSKIDSRTSCNTVFLADALDKKLSQNVMRLKTATDEFRVHGREIYWLRRKRNDGDFSTVALVKILRRPFTVRSLNTVERIAAKYFSRPRT
jgi:uncharacterized protein (DUF1697 family)